MASTRNRNSEGDYQAQQKSLQLQFDNMTYTNQGNGAAFSTHFAGDGLLMGRMGSIPLSNNFVDVESHLHGTGSTNLVTPMKPVVLSTRICIYGGCFCSRVCLFWSGWVASRFRRKSRIRIYRVELNWV